MTWTKTSARNVKSWIVSRGRGKAPTDPFHQPLRGPIAALAPTIGALVERCRTHVGAVYLGDHSAVCRCLGLFKMYVDTRDHGFAVNLLLDGGWEIWTTVFIGQQVRSGMTVVDVGANYGYYTLVLAFLAGEAGQVIAVEPNPAAAAKLRASVELNGAAPRVSVFVGAAGAVDGEALLFVPDGEPKNATIVASPEIAGERPGSLHRVPQTTLDRLLEAAPRVDFVKIDAEGAEQAILDGMRGVLARHRPGLVLEFNALRCADPAAFLRELAAVYSRLYYIGERGEPVEISAKQLLEERYGQDWMLCLGFPLGG